MRTCLLLVVLAMSLLSGCGKSKESAVPAAQDQANRAVEESKDVARAEPDKLDGKWWLVGAEQDGARTGALVIVASRRCLIVEGTSFKEVVGDGMSLERGGPICETRYEGTLHINSQSNPKEIDLHYQDVKDGKDQYKKLDDGKLVLLSARKKGKTLKGIYRSEADTLVICISDGDRPKDFVTKPKDKTEIQLFNRSGQGQWR